MVRLTKFFLVIAWMLLIFTSSAIAFPDVDPGREKTLYDYVFDKDMHVLLFGGLAFLTASFLYQYPLRFRWLALWSLTVTALYGISDEYHQLFVTGREASGYDLAFDVIGGIGGVVMYALWGGVKKQAGNVRNHARVLHRRLRLKL